MLDTPEGIAVMESAKAATIEAVQTVVYNGIAPANATGNLANSIAVVPTPVGFDVVATGEAARYVGTLRYGRRPGGAVPIVKILAWMDAKGVAAEVTGSKRKGVAFAISRKIMKEGNVVHRRNMAPTNIWDGAVQKIQTEVAGYLANLIVKAV